jgi:mRNA interferase MazF
MASRGEVWLANLNPGHRTEPGKTRPVLIVQAQALMEAGHPSTIVAPLTSQFLDDAFPLRVRIPASGEMHEEPDALIHQLRAIDDRRLARGPLLRLMSGQLREVDAAIRAVLDLDDDSPVAIDW